MPCRDGYSEQERSDIYQRQRDDLITMLCMALRLLEKNSVPIPTRIAPWWRAHKREDKERKAQQARDKIRRKKIKAAKSKLTAEEQALLGV